MEAIIVIGLGFGDEGKGSIVDWLTREHDSLLTVRFNGGAQAAHHVVTPEGKEHTFHNFGSGTLAGAQTYLTRDVLVNPLAIALEAAELMDLGVDDPFKRLWIHEWCPITTPYHVALNRLKEISRGSARHGSCGLGIGETMEDITHGANVMRWFDVLGRNLRPWLTHIREAKLQEAHKLGWRGTMAWSQEFRVLEGDEDEEIVETYQIVANAVNSTTRMPLLSTVVFEGAQGILIDEKYGQPPYHTWSNCTPRNALDELRRNRLGVEPTILGVTRAYMTRHGAGPLPTETTNPIVHPDKTNEENPWQGKLRYGYPDRHLVRYAAEVCRSNGGLDGVIVTCVDQLQYKLVPVADTILTTMPFEADRAYNRMTPQNIPGTLARAAEAPLYATSHGPTAADKFQEIALTISS